MEELASFCSLDIGYLQAYGNGDLSCFSGAMWTDFTSTMSSPATWQYWLTKMDEMEIQTVYNISEKQAPPFATVFPLACNAGG